MQSEMPTSADARFRPGVGIMLLNASGDVLVGRRNDVPDEEWQMPQGGIGDGEDPRAAAFRELKEEIGTDRALIIGQVSAWLTYDVPGHLLRPAWKGKYRGQTQRWFALRFTGTEADIDLNTGDRPEFDAWRWVAIEDLPGLAIAFKRAMYERVVAEFRPLALALPAASGGPC